MSVPQPVELDIAVGIGGSRAAYHLEQMGHVDPIAFVAAVQEFVCRLLREGENGTPQASATAGEDNLPVCAGPSGVGSGEVVEPGEGGSPSGSSGDEPPKPARQKRPQGTVDQRWTAMEARRKARIDERLKARGVA